MDYLQDLFISWQRPEVMIHEQTPESPRRLMYTSAHPSRPFPLAAKVSEAPLPRKLHEGASRGTDVRRDLCAREVQATFIL